MIHSAPLTVDSKLAEQARAQLNSAAGIEGAVAMLRAQGQSKIASIRVMVAVGHLTLAQANAPSISAPFGRPGESLTTRCTSPCWTSLAPTSRCHAS